MKCKQAGRVKNTPIYTLAGTQVCHQTPYRVTSLDPRFAFVNKQ